MVYAAAPAPSRQLEMWFNGPQQQRRWTVLIRLIMVIPQAIVLFILEIALLFVTIIGWFAALVIGRLPLWIHQFNSGYVRWYTRVVAYVYLMTDEYPPFEFDDLPYPARPIMAPPGTLNRLAVLFRIILVIPAYFFQTIVNYGLVLPMLFVAWIIMIFTGRMPPALYWAYSSWVRYGARVMAYVLLTTSEYPWGMLGDSSPGTPFAPPPPAPVPYATTTPAATSSPAAGITSEAEGGSAQARPGQGPRRLISRRRSGKRRLPHHRGHRPHLLRPGRPHGPHPRRRRRCPGTRPRLRHPVRNPGGTGSHCPRAPESGSSSRSYGDRSCSSPKSRSRRSLPAAT